MSDYFYAISLLTVFATCVLSFIIVLAIRSKKIHTTYLFIPLTVAIWSLGRLIFVFLDSKEWVFFWIKFAYIGSIFIPVAFMEFVICIIDDHKYKRNLFIKILYFFSGIAFLSVFSEYFISDVHKIMSFNWYDIPGPLFSIYSVTYTLLGGYAFYFLLRKLLEKNDSTKKTQLISTFSAAFFGFIGGATTFPLVYGIEFYPYGVALIPLYPLIITFSIFKYKFMGIKLLEQQIEDRTQELEKALKQLKETEAQLVHSEKLASMGKFAAGVAHELYTPLSSIDGAIYNINQTVDELATEDQKKSDSYKDVKETTKRTSYWLDRCRKIIDSLLHFSRKDREGWNIININEGIENTLIMLEGEIRDKVKINKVYNEIPNIEADLGQLNQVFMNILSNSIELFSDNKQKNAIINIQTSTMNNDKIKIVFEDNAGGVKAGILDKIFDPFFTTKPVGKGTGLGLNICYNIINSHHGKILAENIEKNKGLRIIIHLPVKQPKE